LLRNVLFGTYKVLQKLDREVGTDGKMLCNDKSSNNPWPDELKSSKGNILFSLFKGMNLFYLFNNNIEIKHVFICLFFLHIKFVQVNDFVESGTRYLDTKIKFTIYNNISVV
jgi:hypothetical protein